MSTSSGKISTASLREERESLKNNQHRPNTKKNYHGIWTAFNKFLIKLDQMPQSWEEKTSLYCTYLISKSNIQSSTIRSYVSAIKSKVSADGYIWEDEKVWLAALTKSCKIKNDQVLTRLPIQKELLQFIIFEIERKYNSDVFDHLYKRTMYKSAILVAYYGLLRIGEYTVSEHAFKAKDIHEGRNKDKYLIILYSSKTHGKDSKPQKIRIDKTTDQTFCPFEETASYINIRPPYRTDEEQFYVSQDYSPMTAAEFRKILKKAISNLNLNPELYDTHSLRIGRATDLQKHKISVDTIKEQGRWQSNAVYNYLRGW